MSDEVKPVYPEFHNKGVRFQLHSNGSVTARTKDIEPREVFTLNRSDTGEPWIPSHKSFNSLCRESVREGDVDDLISAQERISTERGRKRNAGVELYEALHDLVTSYERLGSPLPLAKEVEVALEALAKARGE